MEVLDTSPFVLRTKLHPPGSFSISDMYTGLLLDSMSLLNLYRTQGLEDRSDLSWDSTYSGILHTVSHNLGPTWYVHGSGTVSLQDGLPEHLEK